MGELSGPARTVVDFRDTKKARIKIFLIMSKNNDESLSKPLSAIFHSEV